MTVDDQVRYELLRPAQAVARRKACPLAYLPVGTIEFHGVHNPLGLDGLQAHGVCERAARRGGGVVFPPVWYGENRASHLAEANPPVRDAIAGVMDLPPTNFSSGAAGPLDAEAQSLDYQRLLFHIYHQIRALGFTAVYVLVGHGPLRPYVALTTMVFERETGVKMDFSFATELVEGVVQDHGARVETGTMMALRPDLVDLSELPDGDASQIVGVSGQDPREGAEAFGRSFVPACVEALATRATALLQRLPSRGDMTVT